MTLREVVEKYLAVTGVFGKPAALSSFGLTEGETEGVFGLLDEDYHISRFFHFTAESGASYRINGFPQTHVSIDAEVQTAL